MGATYKLKRKKADGTLEDVILQGVITDLGELDGHQPAENTILELLKPSTVPTGDYLYTYETPCNADAVLAICYKSIDSIYGTQYTSAGQYRKFVYSFDEDSVTEQVCLRNMGVELTDELGDRWDVAMSQWGVTEALKQVGGGIPFVQPTSYRSGFSYQAAQWAVANVGGITEPTDGMTIAVRTPNDGDSYGILLSIDNGSNYYPIVRNKDTSVGREYPKNTTLILTFNATQTSSVYLTGDSTLTTVTGCWQIADRDEDNRATQYYTTTNGNYPLLFKYASGVSSKSNVIDYARYANNIYVNPSTGTVYANDFVVDGKSIVSGGGSSSGIFDDDVEFNGITTFNDDANFNSPAFFYGGALDENDMHFPQAITSTNSQIAIEAQRLGSYFNLTAEISAADELTIAGNSISLTSDVSSIITIEGHLRNVTAVDDRHIWYVLVSVYERNGTKPTANTYAYTITTDRNGFRIGDTSSYSDTVYTGIICR